ncbi:hypothetical protein PR202_gb16204 [Eleusine coracana subsp. coracana]|uniref:Uncharacterized protein n=1 Tax=Eleusine coracana subsp. coracana TaxID=191504 RepID=A0AAV5F110_ELECO|nr:hypothetical protein QOZ80_9BG0701580 [Eleusine coracana subsp. coracana]GJN28120.1 hypothetical protein PR202_gb16204 [Eleusine coracana subsp. coracana]
MCKAPSSSGAVRVVGKSRVAPARVPPAIADDYPGHLKLSFLDAPWIATPPVKQVFLYSSLPDDDDDDDTSFRVVVARLKSSLASTLALFLPFAGKLAYVAETGGDVVVDYSDDPGVSFFEAEADFFGDVQEALLVPEHDLRVLDDEAPVLRVQATRVGRDIAVGVSLHHAVADGHGMALFIDAWATACRTAGSPSPPPPELVAVQLQLQHGREAVFARVHHADLIARDVLHKVAPSLPVSNTKERYSIHSRLAQRTFHLHAARIKSLKQRIIITSLASSSAKPVVSTFVAVSALCWVAFVKAKRLPASADTHLIFQIDIRSRLRPPVTAGYTGNCIRGCVATARAGDLLLLLRDGEEGLLRAARAVRAAVAEVEAAPLDDGIVTGEWVERVSKLPRARTVQVAGSPMFRVYEMADFGFGRPTRVEPIAIPGSPVFPLFTVDGGDEEVAEKLIEGRVVVYAGVHRGDLQLSVALDDQARVDAFVAHVVAAADDNNDNPRPKI